MVAFQPGGADNNASGSSRWAPGSLSTSEADGGEEPSFISRILDRSFYNHRKYFILGYFVFFLVLVPLPDPWSVLCFFPALMTIYFFGKAFALRNVLVLHHRSLYRGAAGEEAGVAPFSSSPSPSPSFSPSPPPSLSSSPSPSSARTTPGDTGWTDFSGTSDPDAWSEARFDARPGENARDLPEDEGALDEMEWDITGEGPPLSEVPPHGITTPASAALPHPRPGVFYRIGPLGIERYLMVFAAANTLLFGSYLLARVWSEVFCGLGLIALLLLLFAIADKVVSGVRLYPVYRDMVARGLIYDQVTGKIGSAHQWFDRYYRKSGEMVISSDSISLANWKPHSYTLTDRGIYLEERTGLFSGKRFLYIPLLSLKGLKLTREPYNKTYMWGALGSGIWAFLISTPGSWFFFFMLLIAGSQVILAFIRTGNQIQGRALNLTFTLSREVDTHLMRDRMIDIDLARGKRKEQPDADRELRSYAWMDEFPPTPGLQEVKKSVRIAWTGLILPTFFYSMIKLADIFDEDTEGAMFFVLLFGLFAVLRMITAASNVWKYQKYLERPGRGSVRIGSLIISGAEILILAGYLLIGAGITRAIFHDFLPHAYAPGILGGILVLAGRYLFNPSFRGIDYLEKGAHSPEYTADPRYRFFTDNKRLGVPAVWFMILLVLMGITLPYFSESRAEVPATFLDPNKGNGWIHETDHDEDMFGLMGVFTLHLRVYNNTGEKGGYPAILSVLTMRFPVTPSEGDMLKRMRRFMAEIADEQQVILEEPPETGTGITTQGYEYQYFIYKGTGKTGTSTFSRGEEIRIIVTAAKIDPEKAFVISMGIAKISDGRLVDIVLPPPFPPVPNPTNTTDETNWNTLRNELIPNIRI